MFVAPEPVQKRLCVRSPRGSQAQKPKGEGRRTERLEGIEAGLRGCWAARRVLVMGTIQPNGYRGTLL